MLYHIMQTAAAHINYQPLYEDITVKYEALQVKHTALLLEVEQLKKMIFGSRHERFIPTQNNPAQLTLDVQAEQVAQCNIIDAKQISYTRITSQITEAKVHPGRMKLPEHLQRREIIIEPKEDTTHCKKIGEEITEELEYEPGKLFVNKIVRPKYARPNNGGVVTAPMVERPLPKAIAGAGLLAQIVIDKYVDHLPLYRQMERFKREGIVIPYSTVTDWVSGTCRLIEPLYEALKRLVLQSDYLHADESPIKVLDKDKKGTTHRGYYWVYHNSVLRLVFFEYQPGRGKEHPENILKGFKGYLQTDGYPGYDFLKQQKDITVLNCMAHARRMFYDALENDKSRAEYALQQFGLLYDIERKAVQLSMDPDEVKQLRQKEAVPVLQSFGQWMQQEYIKVPPKSTIAQALQYSIGRWKALSTYTTNGKLKIDNNPVENSIRPVAIGRKNYLFAGSHEAAQRSAMLYALLGTCKLHDLNPFIWLKDILKRLPTHHINKIEELLPQNWTPTQK